MMPHVDLFARFPFNGEAQSSKRERERQASIRSFGINFPGETFREELQTESIEARIEQLLYAHGRRTARVFREQVRQISRLIFREHDVTDTVLVRLQVGMIDQNFALLIRADFEIAFDFVHHATILVNRTTRSSPHPKHTPIRPDSNS